MIITKMIITEQWIIKICILLTETEKAKKLSVNNQIRA